MILVPADDVNSAPESEHKDSILKNMLILDQTKASQHTTVAEADEHHVLDELKERIPHGTG